jgi:hypothetical protein
VWNLVCHISGRIQAEDGREQGPAEGTGASVGGGKRRPEKSLVEELFDLFVSPNIINVITSWRKRWAGHVARTGEEKCIRSFAETS